MFEANPNYASLKSIQTKILDGEISHCELANYYLGRCQLATRNNVFVEVYYDAVLEKAAALDEKIKNHEKLGELHGLFISLKDVISHKDQGLTAASKILHTYISPFNATVVEYLLSEDAIIIGRTNCDQFGMGSDNSNSIYGPTRNGINSKYVPGGSSGASAVSVQLDTCLVALGSDTGGSVRQPAAFTGTIGFKPTYGRISRYGLIAYASSFDQIGIIGKNVDDIAKVFNIISNKNDVKDSTSLDSKAILSDKLEPSKLSISYPLEVLEYEGLNNEIKSFFLSYLDKLGNQGHKIKPVSFDLLDYIVPTYYVLATAEASSNLGRYDGVRFGQGTRTEGFSDEVKRRILLGTFVLSSGYYDAYYTQAQKIRRLILGKAKEVLSQSDFILMPTAPTFPWKIGAVKKRPTDHYLADIFTVFANIIGHPAMHVSLDSSHAGWPLGVQLIGDKNGDQRLLRQAEFLLANYTSTLTT